MVYVTNGGKKYQCTAPDEHRINIHSQKRQWVIDFTICDSISAAEMDALLDGNDLVFIYVDDATKEEKVLTFSGYTTVNSASIKYNQDLSCTALVQLGKEIISNVC